jgi:hypothetical protein
MNTRKKKLTENKNKKKNKNKNKNINTNTNTNTNNKTFKKLNCSPTTNGKVNDYTCYSDSSLMKLRNYWNKRHPDHLITSNNSKEIWTSLKDNMSDVCDKESCWLRQKFIHNNLDKELTQYTFAPKSPTTWIKNKNEWLSSVEIEKVMKQYETAFPNFAFIGPSPIDFDTVQMYGECVWEELCKFVLNDYLKDGKTKIGIIFNTDPHYKDGSHWISLFIDVKQKYIFYFDSNGDPPPKQIKVFEERVASQGRELGINFEITGNYPKEHQLGDTECGMYSLYFIIELLTDRKNIDFFKKSTIRDHQMELLRSDYFNKDL